MNRQSFGVVTVMTLLAGCAAEPDGFSHRHQRSTVQSDLNVFVKASEDGVLLAATDSVEVGDRVVLGENGAFGPISNVGKGTLRVGTDAKVGGIWSSGPVDLRDRSHVYGDVKAPQVWKGYGVTIDGSSSGSAGDAEAIDIAPFDLPAAGGDINIEPDRQRNLAPGSYGTLSIKSRAQLTLASGDYSFSNIYVEPQGKIVLQAGCPKTRIQSRQGFFFRGQIQALANDGKNAALSFVHSGTQTVQIEAPFRGEVLAPKAEVVLSSQQHAGRFFAKRVRVQAGGSVSTLDALAESCLAQAPAGPAVIGEEPKVPPALDGPEQLDTFLDWYYRIRPSQIPDVRLRMAKVATNGPMFDAVLERFQLARQSREQGKSLMLLSLIGTFDLPQSKEFLLSLLAEALPGKLGQVDMSLENGKTNFNAPTTNGDIELGYRKKVVTILKSRQSATALAAIRDVATSHDVSEMRSFAIGVLVANASNQEKEELRNALQDGDKYLIDRPRRGRDNFESAVAAYLKKYQK